MMLYIYSIYKKRLAGTDRDFFNKFNSINRGPNRIYWVFFMLFSSVFTEFHRHFYAFFAVLGKIYRYFLRFLRFLVSNLGCF